MNTYVSAAALRASLFTALAVCTTGHLVFAQTVPPPWAATDVGAPALAGRASYDAGSFTIEAAGAGLWGSSDQFYFVYQQFSGDVEIVARVDSLAQVDPRTSAGVMIRSALTPEAAHAYTSMTPGGNLSVRWRSAAGARTTATSGSRSGAPVWLRIERKGSVLTGFSSADGTNWVTIGSSSVALGSTAYVGLAVASRRAATIATAILSNVSVRHLDTGTPPPSSGHSGLPSNQESTDIGSPAIAGRTIYASGTYTIDAGGADIWGTADQFHYVYQPITGSGEVVARVLSLTNTDSWAKAGVMIRESITAQSRHAMMVVTPGSGYAFQRRPETGRSSIHTSGGPGVAPGWVKLVRAGDLFTAYRSADGQSWELVGSDTIPMSETVYVGLAVTSHNAGAATTAVIDNLKITAASSTNQPPAISITTPANGSTFTAPATVTISATANDPENRMLSVDFYVDSTMLVRDTSAPYSAAWSALAAGTFSLTAVAHDADGGSTRSAAVSVTVASSTAAPARVVFTASADHATNVTYYVLKVFTAGANTATATPVATSDLGKPTPDSNGEISVDRSAFFSALAAGNYVATVTAVGPGGQTQSGSVSFTR